MLVGRRLPRHRPPTRPTHLGLIHYFLIAGSLGDPRLRASNEHILIVRVSRAGGRPGCPSLFLHRHSYRDRLQRIVEFVARSGDDLVYYFHASKDFAEDSVGSVQSAAVIDTDIELRAVIVGVSRAVAFARDFRHADRASFVRPIAGFRIEPIAGAARPLQGTVWIFTRRIAAVLCLRCGQGRD